MLVRSQPENMAPILQEWTATSQQLNQVTYAPQKEARVNLRRGSKLRLVFRSRFSVHLYFYLFWNLTMTLKIVPSRKEYYNCQAARWVLISMTLRKKSTRRKPSLVGASLKQEEVPSIVRNFCSGTDLLAGAPCISSEPFLASASKHACYGIASPVNNLE